MKRLRARLFVVLSCLSLTSLTPACGPKQANTPEVEAEKNGESALSEEEAFKRFADSPYTYCDAKLLSAYWGADISDAKARIGRSLEDDKLATEMTTARDQAFETGNVCDFFDTGYVYEDADAMAMYWGMSLDQAKSEIGLMATAGESHKLAELVAAAHDMRMGDVGRTGVFSDADPEFISVWEESNYNYCDAYVLGYFWGTDAWEAKGAIGFKIANGLEGQLTEVMLEARTQAVSNQKLCAYNWEFSFDDAELLAAHWGTDVTSAKVRMENKLTLGEKDSLVGSIEEARAAGPR